MNLTRDELQVLLWACEHEILRLPSERNENQTLALLSATTKVREAYGSGRAWHREDRKPSRMTRAEADAHADVVNARRKYRRTQISAEPCCTENCPDMATHFSRHGDIP